MRSESSMKSTTAARFLSRKGLRACHVTKSLTPMASREVNRSRAMLCRAGSYENGTHRRKWRLDHGVVAFRLQPMLVQHRLHGDVDGAALGVGGDNLALEV